MTLQFFYMGQIDTHEQIHKLYKDHTSEQKNKFCETMTLILYQFNVSYNNNTQYTIYRTHDEIAKFLKHYNKKARQLKTESKLTFQQLKYMQSLSNIIQINLIIQQTWFKQFFLLNNLFPGQKISINLLKQSGGRHFQYQCCIFLKWKKCLVYILNDGIVTYNQPKKKIQQFLHFTKDFSWQLSQQLQQLKIYLHSSHRKLTLQSKTSKQLFIFTYTLNKYLQKYKKQQMEYRYNSFAPVRYANQIDFFIDGAQYFQSVAHAIENSQQSVFICGWWVSPQFMLIRSRQNKCIDFRLDKLLARTAKKGVKIYIIVYYQSSFLSNDSTYTIQALQTLHSNIKVLRHPQIVLPTFWSHHQKLVIIDQSVAFMGGLDICYGRYDTQQHLIDQNNKCLFPGIEYNNCRIADFTQVRQYWQENIARNLPRLPWHDIALRVRGGCVKDLSRHFIEYWNYASYQTHYANRYVLVANSNKQIPQKKNNLFQSLLELAKQKIISPKQKQKQQNNINIQNLQNIQNPNHKQIILNRTTIPTTNKNLTKQQQQLNKSQTLSPKTNKKYLLSNVLQKLSPHKLKSFHFYQKQFNASPRQEKQNMIHREQKQSSTQEAIFLNNQQYPNQNNTNQIDIIIQSDDNRTDQINQQKQFQKQYQQKIQKKQKQVQFRMSQLAQIDQQIQHEQNIQSNDDQNYIQQKKQLPNIQSQSNTHLLFFTKARDSIVNKLFNTKKSQSKKPQPKISIPLENSFSQPNQNYICQAVRSASQWSIGCTNTHYQKSIYDSYLQLITKSQKFIYIENQFFISSTSKNCVVKNKIMDALCNRVIKAIQQKSIFKLIIIMPLIPGFAGELDDPNASLPRVIMNWQYKTLCKGEGSLFNRLRKHTDDPSKYVQIFGLRKHGLIGGCQPVTQIIYLHSKLMIIDDRYLICGSANINDRSMQGNRDSQLCLIVESPPQKDVIFGNSAYKVVQKIHNLRIKLWQQHFGISQFKVHNAINEKIWQQIKNIAHCNTLTYRKIFGCYPDDEIKSLIQIRPFKKIATKQQYDEQSHKIQGHAVQFPLKFLQNQKLTSYHPNAIST